ncbi:MAG: leucine-rich repeat domain-containing protein, partial [Paludibacteraceae bacterium]|nr:leucine-rich repeat domain-containing protein [Paludibacteraceae bacterium]
MKKKIIAIIVAIVLIIPVSRGWYEFLFDNFFDAELASSTQLKFRKISDTEVEVVGYDSDYGSKLTVPIKVMIGLHTYKVTSIREKAFSGCSSLTSIKIPEGVTSIGRSAFDGCSSLEPKLLVYDKGTKCYGWVGNKEKFTDVVIPEGVTSIGEWAFKGCSSLTSIKIPEGVTSIGYSTFSGCNSLEPKLLVYDKGTKCYGWIGNKEKCTDVVIPEGVTSIGGSAFYRCSSLTSINIPESVTSIGGGAFYYCESLTSINIPEGLT